MASLKLLKENIEIKTETFETMGLKVENVSVQSAELLQGLGIKFFIEVTSEKSKRILGTTFKVNVYDEEGELLDVGERYYWESKFAGFDTIQVDAYVENIIDNATKAKVYVTK